MNKSNELNTSTYQSLTHSKWDCKYHIVFIPKCRRKVLYGKVKPFLGKVFHELAVHRGCKILKGNLSLDHVHMLIEIPPKHAVCTVIGYIKGKSAISIARHFNGRERNFMGEHFWARGYAVSTVGFEEAQVRAYIQNQERLDSCVEEGIF